jgi:DNA ligase (NAD+)
MVESLRVWLLDERNQATLARLLALGVSTPEPSLASAASGPLSGQSFCVTGVLSEPREAVHATIRAAGGEVHDKVKKGTTYLVAGEKVGQAKLRAAEKVGARVLDEPALRALIAGSPPS